MSRWFAASIAVVQILSVPVASIADAWLGARATYAAHVENTGATHDDASHPHECALCRLARTNESAVPSRPDAVARQSADAEPATEHIRNAAREVATEALPRAPPVRVLVT